jgi:hypothetical protein
MRERSRFGEALYTGSCVSRKASRFAAAIAAALFAFRVAAVLKEYRDLHCLDWPIESDNDSALKDAGHGRHSNLVGNLDFDRHGDLACFEDGGRFTPASLLQPKILHSSLTRPSPY